jgi:hypothetical protein
MDMRDITQYGTMVVIAYKGSCPTLRTPIEIDMSRDEKPMWQCMVEG